MQSPIDHMTPLSVPSSRRTRHKTLELILLLSLLLLTIVAVTPLHNLVLQPFFRSSLTPPITVQPGDNLFYFDLPWGSITIDGQRIDHPPTDITSAYPPLRLALGTHTIVWHADPLPPITCFVSVPSFVTKETCDTFSSVLSVSDVPSSVGVQIRRLTFQASLALLSPNLRQSLLQAIQTTLDTTSGTVQLLPSEPYVQSAQGMPVGVGTLATAHQVLQAQLHLTLDTDVNSPYVCISGDLCRIEGQDCHLICSEGASDAAWPAIALVSASWTYQTPDGRIVAQNQPDTTTNAYGTEHSVSMNLQWDGQHWHVMLEANEIFYPNEHQYGSTDPACAQVTSMLTDNEQYMGPEKPITITTLKWSFFPASNRSEGCLAVALPSSNPSAQSPMAYCLYRAGVLLAANDVAHRYWPNLPLADTYEQQGAQQIAAVYSGSLNQL